MRPKARAIRLAAEISDSEWQQFFWLMVNIFLPVNLDIAGLLPEIRQRNGCALPEGVQVVSYPLLALSEETVAP